MKESLVDMGMLEKCMYFFQLQVFGSSIVNAMLSHDMLIVMYASGYVRFYSFPHILEKVQSFYL